MNYHVNILLITEAVFRKPEMRTDADINSHLLLQDVIKALKLLPEHNAVTKQYVVRNTVVIVRWDRNYQSFLLAYNYPNFKNFYEGWNFNSVNYLFTTDTK